MSLQNKNKRISINSGFTLIELLVVISVISLLSSIILVTLNNVRMEGRDAKRIADIKEVQKAVELFKSSTGKYPGASGTDAYAYFAMAPYITGNTVYDCGYVDVATGEGRWCRLERLLVPYMPQLPRDNIGTPVSYRYHYKYSATVDKYGISVILEVPNALSQNDGGYFSNRFEIGELPAYCRSKYSGTGGDWTYWSSQACRGGN